MTAVSPNAGEDDAVRSAETDSGHLDIVSQPSSRSVRHCPATTSIRFPANDNCRKGMDGIQTRYALQALDTTFHCPWHLTINRSRRLLHDPAPFTVYSSMVRRAVSRETFMRPCRTIYQTARLSPRLFFATGPMHSAERCGLAVTMHGLLLTGHSSKRSRFSCRSPNMPSSGFCEGWHPCSRMWSC